MKKVWQTKKLREVCELVNGRAYSKLELLAAGKYRVLRVGNFFTNDHWYYSDMELEEKKYCDTGDLLYAWSASFGPRMWTGGKVIYHYHIWKVVHDRAQIDQKFLFYFFQWDTEKIKEDQGTGTTMMHVSMGSMNERDIHLPPLAEQQRIVGLLDDAFEGIATAKANAEKNLQNARALFESHLQSVFTQRGPGWVETTLEKATSGVFTGPFGSLLHKHDYVENGIPLVNPAHITDTGIEPDMRKTVSEDTAKRLANYIMREGDVVIGRRGEMGRCALVTEVEDGWLCGTGSFYIKPSDRCDMGYLVRYLRSEGCRRQLETLAGGAVMPNLSNTALSGLSMFLPPLRKQKEIVDGIDVLHEETQRLARLYERKLAALEALKKSLLHQAFAGEL
ncbi:restriction endonuclease subunit S [Prosthecobacter dejongeii]|uniref:Type I restriction enzyme S subunit n=1 Tax=Prosthecobacter dejongeii TaxID=48465 RepID=A0A7W7YQG5_9BACT|nr:restriction endonuclease subunit S [Prosthecobacter dejongeii]MBB5040464.1 type I restriction enzyme S subunit [Prosthecobacter dejongeii]